MFALQVRIAQTYISNEIVTHVSERKIQFTIEIIHRIVSNHCILKLAQNDYIYFILVYSIQIKCDRCITTAIELKTAQPYIIIISMPLCY